MKGSHAGAVWHKTDFQCHTPRDRGWRGTTVLPGGTDAADRDRLVWARTLIAECGARGISAIAITDHHDICLFPVVQKAGTEANPPVLVFPGIEITCADNAQCIAIFDPIAPLELPLKLLALLPGVMPSPANEAKTCAVDPATLTVAQLFDAIANDPHLRDNCLLFPHFSDGDAHKHINADGHHTRFAELECLGVYAEKDYASLAASTKDKAYGKIDEWGRQRRPFIITGDNKSEDFGRLGAFKCWVKLGEPTLEALRQSLLADEARIAYDDPTEPSERIERLQVKSSLLGDAPVTINFNPGFNTFIGGRGSGKSAVLEYLRFGLARTERDLGRSDRREREQQLIEDTLENGFVEVVLNRNGVRESWRRDLLNEFVLITEEDGNQLSLTLEEARARFRSRAFFQKQLSSTTRNTTNTTDEITGIAAAEALDKRREVDQEIENAKREVGTALQLSAAHWQTTLERDQARARLDDLRKQIANLTKRMAEEGVSEVDLKVIADAPRYARGKAFLSNIARVVDGDRNRMPSLKESILKLAPDLPSDVVTFPELQTLLVQLSTTREEIVAHFESIADALTGLEERTRAAAAAFGVGEMEFYSKHADAVVRQTAHKALIDENARLSRELSAAEEKEAALSIRFGDSESAIQKLADARRTLAELLEKRRDVLSVAAAEVAQKSNAFLKARLKRDPSPLAYVGALSELLDGAHVPDGESRCQNWIEREVAKDPDTAWQAICDQALEIHEAIIRSGKPPEPMDDIARKLKAFLALEGNVTPRQIARVYQNINDASLSRIVAACPVDYIVLTYVDEGRDIAFAKASEGQQASALLELLLSQSAGTLIIDQPEDDLDNRIIMRIVNLIRGSKSRRQIIFATHNPNLVVNGDADKVIALKSGEQAYGAPATARIQILEDGAIETPEVKRTITQIMEGGKEAFDLRSRKYGYRA